MSQSPMTIAVYGGAFDPVHLGHEATIQHLIQHYMFDRIHVVPYALSAFDKQPIASGEDRLAMLHLVCDHSSRCHVDTRELRRSGCSYAIDTVRSIAGEHPTADIFMVLSTESLASFARWKQWQDVIKIARILCISRATVPPSWDADLAGYVTTDALRFDRLSTKRIYLDGFVPPSMSSSAIRHCLQHGIDIEHCLNPHVCQHIQHHGLYHRPKDNV